MNQPNTDYDNPWKSIIELYFRDFINFFFPWIEPEIDWSRPIKFLDKELQKVVRDAELKKRYADKLAQVYRIDGQPALVLCHVEVQNQEETDFGFRMYHYNYRLRDRYKCPVISLAILGDENSNWRPTGWQETLWGCSTSFEFPIVKLLDYQANWAMLESSPNPFAIVVMAHLKTKATHGNPSERKTWKFRLTTMLYDRGYSEQDILELFHFLDWLIVLPESLEQEFQIELETFEEGRQMKYVTAIERMAEQRGEQQGIQQGEERKRRSIALKMLQRGVSLELVAEVTDYSLEELQALAASSLETEEG